MSNKDLTRELKQTIKELTEEKEDLLRNISSKESRVKQILIQLELLRPFSLLVGVRWNDLPSIIQILHGSSSSIN